MIPPARSPNLISAPCDLEFDLLTPKVSSLYPTDLQQNQLIRF